MIRTVLFIFLLSAFGNVSLAGGGWVAKKGDGYVKLGQSVIYADELFNRGGSRSSITTTGVYISELYAEYGLGSNLEAMVRMPFFLRTTINEVRYRSGGTAIAGDEFNYPGDPSVGLKYALVDNKPIVLALSLRLDFPLGKTDGGNSDIIQTGDGEFNQLLKFEAGHSSSDGRFYQTAGLGFNNRTEGFSDEFHFNAEAGFKFGEYVLAIAKVSGIESFRNGDVSGNTTGIFSNNMEQLLAIPQLVINNRKGMGVELSYAYPLRGENILAAPIYQLALFYKFRN